MASKAGASGLAMILGLIVATVLGALGGYTLARRELAYDLYRRPPVAILETARFQAALAADGGDGTSDQVAAAVREAARRLADGGYVVLDSQAVLAAPGDVYVPVD